MLALILLLGSLSIHPEVSTSSGSPVPGRVGLGLMAHADTSLLGELYIAREHGGPLIVTRPLRSLPLIAIRLSIPYQELPGLENAGRVLQLISEERARSEIRRFGGRLELSQTPTHLVYSLSGPSANLGELASVLRYLVSAPVIRPGTEDVVWHLAQNEALGGVERADLAVRRQLLARLFPTSRLRTGPKGSGQVPDREGLEWSWRRWFRPESSSIVVVGDIGPHLSRAAFSGWTPPPPPGPSPGKGMVPGGTEPETEIMAPRVGIGYDGVGVEPAVLLTISELLSDALLSLGLAETRSEFWWLDRRRALVMLGASPLDTRLTPVEMRIALQLGLADLSTGISAREVRRARNRIRQRLLLRARTPTGLASLIGEFLERTGDPYGLEEFMKALDRTGLDEVRSGLRTLIYTSPEIVELVP